MLQLQTDKNVFKACLKALTDEDCLIFVSGKSFQYFEAD